MAIYIPYLNIQKAQTFFEGIKRFMTYIIEVPGVELRPLRRSQMPTERKAASSELLCGWGGEFWVRIPIGRQEMGGLISLRCRRGNTWLPSSLPRCGARRGRCELHSCLQSNRKIELSSATDIIHPITTFSHCYHSDVSSLSTLTILFSF